MPRRRPRGSRSPSPSSSRSAPARRRTLTSRRERPAPDALPPGRPLKDRVGQAGESAALAWVREQGWTVLARDWRARAGQIDIVAEDGETLVLIEVKARRGTGFGLPAEAVDARKQQKLRTLMETYRLATKRQRQQCRIDVLGLILDDRLQVTRCQHIPNAVGDGSTA